MEIECQLNGQWTALEQCERDACEGDPPGVPSDSGLSLVWNGQPIKHGEGATYRCKDIFKRVSTNPDSNEFQIFCEKSNLEDATTGRFVIPEPLPTCVQTQFCSAPPSVPAMGGRRSRKQYDIFCPESHKYAIENGQACCKWPQKVNNAALHVTCDGQEIQFWESRKCCKFGHIIDCPHPENGKCLSLQMKEKGCVSKEMGEYMMIVHPNKHFLFSMDESLVPSTETTPLSPKTGIANMNQGYLLSSTSIPLNDLDWIMFCGGAITPTEVTSQCFKWSSRYASTIQMLSMSSNRQYARAVTMDDGKIWITGGTSGHVGSYGSMVPLTSDVFFGSILATTEIFDPLTETWSPGPVLPEGLVMHCFLNVGRGKYFFAGGASAYQSPEAIVRNKVYVYYPGHNTFYESRDVPVNSIGAACAVVQVSGRATVIHIGGRRNSNTWNYEVSHFDVSTERWTSGKELTTPNYLGVALNLNGMIHVLGGYSGIDVRNNNVMRYEIDETNIKNSNWIVTDTFDKMDTAVGVEDWSAVKLTLLKESRSGLCMVGTEAEWPAANTWKVESISNGNGQDYIIDGLKGLPPSMTNCYSSHQMSKSHIEVSLGLTHSIKGIIVQLRVDLNSWNQAKLDEAYNNFVDITASVIFSPSVRNLCASKDSVPLTEASEYQFECEKALEGASFRLEKHTSGKLEVCEISIIGQRIPQVTQLDHPIMRNCFELKNLGHNLPGTYLIDVEGSGIKDNAIPVFCKDGWTYFAKRGQYGNAQDYFERNWDEYEKGFGEQDKEYVMGLSYIHKMTANYDYAMRIEFLDVDDTYKSSLVKKFSIIDNVTFEVSAKNYESDPRWYLDDEILRLNSGKFSTAEVDNDINSALECGKLMPWWHKSCFLWGQPNFGLFGMNENTRRATRAKGIYSNFFGGVENSMKEATMALIPTFAIADGECPDEYPFPFDLSRKCCKSNMRGNACSSGPDATNLIFSDMSDCCINDDFVPCPTYVAQSDTGFCGKSDLGEAEALLGDDGSSDYLTIFDYMCEEGATLFDSNGNEVDKISYSCMWDGTWKASSTSQLGTCKPSHCTDIPEPPPDHNLELLSWNGLPVKIGEYLRFKCRHAMKFENDLSISTIDVKCVENGTFQHIPWPKCIEEVRCGPLPSLPSVPDMGKAAIISNGKSFGPCLGRSVSNVEICPHLVVGYNYQYKFIQTYKQYLNRIELTFSVGSLGVLLLRFSDTVYLPQDDLQNLDFIISIGKDPTTIYAQVKDPSVLTKNTRSSLQLWFRRDFVPGYEHCLISIECFENLNQLEEQVDKKYSSLDGSLDPVNSNLLFDTTVEYKCSESASFVMSDGSFKDSLFYQCQWSGDWNGTMYPCKWTSCQKPTDVFESTGLYYTRWDFKPVPINASVVYTCRYGGFFRDDPLKGSVSSICRSENRFEDPEEWPICIEATQCSDPPPTVDGISAIVHSTGVRSRSVCHQELDDISHLGSNYFAFSLKPSVSYDDPMNANVEHSFYNLYPSSPMSSAYVVALATFSIPVDISNLAFFLTSGPIKIVPTSASNVVSFKTYIYNPVLNLTLQTKNFKTDKKPCLVQIVWMKCYNQEECDDHLKNDLSIFDTHENNWFGTSITYTCATGKKFVEESGKVLDDFNLNCDGSDWLPKSVLPPCIQKYCLEPPVPPIEYNLRLRERIDVNGLVEFHTNATYECLPGQFFVEDYFLGAFSMTCQTSGQYTSTPWKYCSRPQDRICPTPPPPYEHGRTSYESNDILVFGTTVHYSCEPAYKLRDSQGIFHDSQTITCQWNEEWSTTQINVCVKVQCIDPPEKENSYNDWNYPFPIDIYESITYKCNPSFYYEDDRNRVSVVLICELGGRFSKPLVWPACVKTTYCPKALKAPKGGIRRWNGDTAYGSKATYECGPHSWFYLGNGVRVNQIKSRCQWNKTWSVTELPECEYHECAKLPVPPIGSRLVRNKAEDRFDHLILSSSYLKYSPLLPISLPVDPEFGKTKHFFVDGVMKSANSSNLVVKIKDSSTNANNVNTFLGFVDMESSMLVASSEVDYKKLTSVSHVNPYEPFTLKLILEPDIFLLTMSMNQGEDETLFKFHPALITFPFIEIKLSGDFDINFAGFVTDSYNYAIPVWSTLTFECEEPGEIFQSWDWVTNFILLTCSTDGQFDTPAQWPVCGPPPGLVNSTTGQNGTCSDNCTATEEPPVTEPPVKHVYSPEEQLYPVTTDYHWPRFNKNATDQVGSWQVGVAPFGFKESVILPKKSCMVDTDFVLGDESCQKNPKNCAKGLSFSIWHKMSFDKDLVVKYHDKITQEKRYIVSNGGDYDRESGKSTPGFSLYYEGPILHAVVSTGDQVWLATAGGQIYNNSWTNVGVRWEKPDNTGSQYTGGLVIYVNSQQVGSAKMAQTTKKGSPTFDEITDYQIDKNDPPVMMVGCHWEQDTQGFDHFADVEIDELAIWERPLVNNATHDETSFYMGGYNSKYDDINPELLKIMVFNADITDDNQNLIANEVISAVVLPPAITPPSIPTPTPPDDLGDGDNATTANPGEVGPKMTEQEMAKAQKDLQDVMSTMLDISNVPAVSNPEKVQFRLAVSIVAGQIVSGYPDTAKKWSAFSKHYPTLEGAALTVNELVEFVLAWSGSTNLTSEQKTNSYDPKEHQFNYSSSGEDYVMNTGKMNLDKFRENKRLHFPNYNGLEWFANIAKWDSPMDTFSIPTGMFKDQPGCNNNPVSYSATIFNNLGHSLPMRRNSLIIRNIVVEVDSKVISTGAKVNLPENKHDAATISQIAKCRPDTQYMQANPVRFTLYHKTPGRAWIVRRILSFFTDQDYAVGGIEVRHCAWWNYEYGTNGAWDPSGCNLVETDAEKTTCECSRFGLMAVILERADPIELEDSCPIQMIVKYIGIAIGVLLLMFFIVATIISKYIWDMFHVIRIHVVLTWIIAITLHVVTDVELVRSDPEINLIVGFFMKFFYTCSCMWMTCEAHSTFKAFTSGIISGRTRVYMPFGYGVPLMPLGVLFLVYHDHLGIDPRCFVGWNNYAKQVYLLFNLAISFIGVIFSLIIVFNLTRPQTKRKNLVNDLTSQAKGTVAACFFKMLLWILALITYLHSQDSDMADPYCYFVIYLGWFGVILFICLGVCSKKFRYGVRNKRQPKKHLLVPSLGGEKTVDEYSQFDNSETAMEISSSLRPATATATMVTNDLEDENPDQNSLNGIEDELREEQDDNDGQLEGQGEDEYPNQRLDEMNNP